MQSVIKAKNLSKRYRIGGRQTHNSLRDAIAAQWKRLRNLKGESGGTIWALKDVTFEVVAGEVLGVIGRNGAGKIDAAQNSLAHY